MESLGGGSKASGSEDEPLVPDDLDDEFFKNLVDKIPQISKVLRQKDSQDNVDNLQRLLICCNRYKSNWLTEESHGVELKDEILALQERMAELAKQNELDTSTISELKEIIEKAWKQKDAAQLREQIAQDEAVRLREKVETLEATINQLMDKRMAMQRRRDDTKELEKLQGEVRELNKRLQIQRNYTGEVEAKVQLLEEKNKELLKLLDENSAEFYSSKKRMDALQNELAAVKADEAKNRELIVQMKSQNDHLTKMKVRQNLQILSLKTNLDHLNTQYNANCNKLAKITVDLEYAIAEKDKNKSDFVRASNLLKVREDEIIALRQEKAKLAKNQDSIARKYAALDEAKREAEEENIRLKTQLSTQDKELESMRRVVHHFERNNDNLTKERDVLKRDLILEHRTAEEFDEMFQESQHEIRALKDTIHIMDMKYKKLMDDYKKINKEKAKKIDEIQSWIDKMDAVQNDLHLKENYEIELKRTISDLEAKCAKFQAQHDVLLNEKNGLQRSLTGIEEEKIKLKSQIDNLQKSIDALKEKVSYRNGEISKLQLQVDRLERERRMMKNEMRKVQLNRQHTKIELQEKKKENDLCQKAMQEDEQKIVRLKKDYDLVLNEKNSISATLTKCNEKYARLEDDLKNLQTVNDQTVKQFQQCQDDMRLMRVEITNLRTERDVLRKDRENSADLRQELLQMHRILNQERIKARALRDEMMTPMNVHRWRNLKGLDPERMDLISKIQILRKQLLSQNFAVLERERALEESQRLYEALKEFMLKLPSHKIREELNSVRAALSGKTKKMKAIMAELNIRAVEEKTSRSQIAELKTNLTQAKMQLNDEKRKKQKLLDERNLLMQMEAQCFSAPPTMQRTLGAGFKMIGTF